MANELWRNICIGCGRVIETHGADMAGPCPGCGGWRFMSHLQNPVEKPMGGQGNSQPVISLPLESPQKEGMTPKQGDGDTVDFGNLAENHKLPAKDGNNDLFDFGKVAISVQLQTRDGDTGLFPNGRIAKREQLPAKDGDPPGKGNGHRGRPQTAIPETLLQSLVDKGLGCKAIARILTARGIPIHYTTIARHLNKSNIQGTNQN